jgi:hypothetical protein
MTTDTIGKFILKDEGNLHIAATVGEVWPEVRQQIVTGFLDGLETRLKKKLKGWQFWRSNRFFVNSWAEFAFYKTAWSDEYHISLHCDDFGQRMAIGVVRHKNDIGKRPFSAELLEAIKAIYESAYTNSWWEVRVLMDYPAADWRKPDVLWRMHKDSAFLDEVEGQLLELAKVSGPFIDGLVRKHKE